MNVTTTKNPHAPHLPTTYAPREIHPPLYELTASTHPPILSYPTTNNMSSPTPTSPTSAPTPEAEEARKKQQAEAAQRYAEVSLKSVPLPPGVDPNARATVGEAVKTIKPEDFTRVHLAPCTRDGLLTGLGTGSVLGFMRYIAGSTFVLPPPPPTTPPFSPGHAHISLSGGCCRRSQTKHVG